MRHENKLITLSGFLKDSGLTEYADLIIRMASADYIDFWQPRSNGNGHKNYAFRYYQDTDIFEVLPEGQGPAGRRFSAQTPVHTKLMGLREYWDKFLISGNREISQPDPAPAVAPAVPAALAPAAVPTPTVEEAALTDLDLIGAGGRRVDLTPEAEGPEDDGAENTCFGNGLFCVPNAIIEKNWTGKAGVDGWQSPGAQTKHHANFHEIESYSGSYRSGAPYLHTEFFKYLKTYGIHTVISLSGTVEGYKGENDMNEESIAEAADMTFMFHSTTENHFPGEAIFDKIHGLVAGGGVLLHCTHGADRTGALISKMEIRDSKRSVGSAVARAMRFGGFKKKNVKMNAWAREG
jgi:protein tyrosine phosphatase (PTP) superfamily phosphohydrolase (DUF442 family)